MSAETLSEGVSEWVCVCAYVPFIFGKSASWDTLTAQCPHVHSCAESGMHEYNLCFSPLVWKTSIHYNFKK